MNHAVEKAIRDAETTRLIPGYRASAANFVAAYGRLPTIHHLFFKPEEAMAFMEAIAIYAPEATKAGISEDNPAEVLVSSPAFVYGRPDVWIDHRERIDDAEVHYNPIEQ